MKQNLVNFIKLFFSSCLICWSLVSLSVLGSGCHEESIEFVEQKAIYDSCNTFFWSSSLNPVIKRYLPKYIRGLGREDYGLDNIGGSRIIKNWSKQAHKCILSSNSYGYFGSSAYQNQTYLDQVRDILAFVEDLEINSGFLDRQNDIKVKTYDLIVEPMKESLKSYTLALTDIVRRYEIVKSDINLVLDEAIPENVRRLVINEFCSAENRANLDQLEDQCNEYMGCTNDPCEDDPRPCHLLRLYDVIGSCDDLPASFDQIINDIEEFVTPFSAEHDAIEAYKDEILTTWDQILAKQPNGTAVWTDSYTTCSVSIPDGAKKLNIVLPETDTAAQPPVYGADFLLLFGDWTWAEFGYPTTNLGKFTFHVETISSMAQRCFCDPIYGRIDKTFFIKHNGESDQNYFKRIFDDLVEIKRSFLSIQLDFDQLLSTHAPLANVTDKLKTIVINAILNFYAKTANSTFGIGWVVERIQFLENSLVSFKQANILTRQLITEYLKEVPELRNTVIARLKNNTLGVLDMYGEFFTQEKRDTLEQLMAQVDQQATDPDIAVLDQLAENIENQIDEIWTENSPLFELGTKLKFIYGSCNPQDPNLLNEYFNQYEVALKMLELPDLPEFCAELSGIFL